MTLHAFLLQDDVYQMPQTPEPSAEIIDGTKDSSLNPMDPIIDEFKKKIKGNSFHNNVPEKDKNYVEFKEGAEDDYIPMGQTSNSEHCYYNNGFKGEDEDSDGIPDYENTDEFTDGILPRNREDGATINYQNVESADNDGIEPVGLDENKERQDTRIPTDPMSSVIKEMKKNLEIKESPSPVDTEDEDPSHDYVNGEDDKSWTSSILPKILVPGHEEETMAPSVLQKSKKSLLRHRGSDPAKTDHERYENTSVQQPPLRSTNAFQSDRTSDRKTPGVHYRPRKVPEAIQETQKETKQKPESSLKSKILSLRPQVRLQSEIYEDVTKVKDGIRPESEHSEEESEDEKPPIVKALASAFEQSAKGDKGANFRNTSSTKKQIERDSTEAQPPEFTCKRSSQDQSFKESYVNVPTPTGIPPPSAAGHISAASDASTTESYVNVPSPAGIPPPSASGHISATFGKDESPRDSYVNVPTPAAIPPPSAAGHISGAPGKDKLIKESYVNVPTPAGIAPPSASGHVSATLRKDKPIKESYVNVPSAEGIPPPPVFTLNSTRRGQGGCDGQNRPTHSIFIPKNYKRKKTIKPSDAESSDEYVSDESDDNIYDDDLVLHASPSDEAVLGGNQRDDQNLLPSLPDKQRPAITKQPVGFGGINPGRIGSINENEEDDAVYEDTDVVIRDVQAIRSEQTDKSMTFPKRNHSNASTKQASVMKSRDSVNEQDEEEQLFYGDIADSPVLPQRHRVQSSVSLPPGANAEVKKGANTQDDLYEFIEPQSVNVHSQTSNKMKAKTLPTNLSKYSGSDKRSAPSKKSMFNKLTGTNKEKNTPKKDTTKTTEPTQAESKVQPNLKMAKRPPMTLPKPPGNLTVSSPDLRTETGIPKVGSGFNTVQRLKVKTIETELGAKLAVRKLQKRMESFQCKYETSYCEEI